jgi:hypothetical protein
MHSLNNTKNISSEHNIAGTEVRANYYIDMQEELGTCIRLKLENSYHSQDLENSENLSHNSHAWSIHKDPSEDVKKHDVKQRSYSSRTSSGEERTLNSSGGRRNRCLDSDSAVQLLSWGFVFLSRDMHGE